MVRILLIEDHKIIIEAYEMMIRQANEDAIIIKAFDCKDALSVIKESTVQFDLAIVDYNLPPFEEMEIYNGGDIVDVLRVTHTNCRVLLLTAYQSPEIIRSIYTKSNTYGIGFKSDIFLEKLVVIISEILDGRKYYTSSVKSILELK